MKNTVDTSNDNKRFIRACEETKEEITVAQTVSKPAEIKQLKCKINHSFIYVSGSEDILPKITEWDLDTLKTVVQEIDSCEESAGGKAETGSAISCPSAILKKISDEEILLAFQQKYSCLADSSNMQSIMNRIAEELIIINDSDDPLERSWIPADNLQSEVEEED